MRFVSKSLIMLMLMCATVSVFAQSVTTSSMSGLVADNSGDPLPGATISAVHEPTNTRYSTVSRANGTWRIVNMRIGGPYTVTATMSGFNTQKDNNIFLKLGEDVNIDFTLQVESVEETLVVTAESNPIINSGRTGAVSSVSEEVVENMPTIGRGFEDLARSNPYFSLTDSGGGASSITVAGRPNRYNNILVDGAVNNDLFGLAASGVPGGQAEAPIISLDAISELQLLVSPYDIRQGGFTGGGVNAVTRTGTNTYEGSLFHFYRDEGYIGDGPDDRPFGTLEETQTGFRVGGPIVKDKAFFFFSGEIRGRDEPSGWAVRPDGQSGSGENFGNFDQINEFRNILINQYGYDPGGLDEVTRSTDSDNYFIRFDFNLTDTQQLTFRHNYVEAESLRLSNDNNTWQFPGNHQFFPNETNSTVIQWNAQFGEAFNELRVSYQTIEDRRTFQGDPFPWIEIENLGNGDEIEAGSERFSTQNALDQDILAITNDFTFVRGNHTITIGTHNELFSFKNLFIRENFGSYEFSDLEDFRNGHARTFNRSFSATDDPQQAAEFDVQQLGFYIGNQWFVNSDLNVTMGLRADIPLFPDTPSANPEVEQIFGFRTDETADGNILWSPRVGFNWDMTGDGANQLRGGIGVFSGRAPYVWISNQYGNTGVDFTRVSAFLSDADADNFIPFNPDPNNQPSAEDLEALGLRVATNEVNVINPDFEMPQLLRATLGYDRELIWGMYGTVELMFGQTLNDIRYQNINWRESGETFFDGRPIMEQVDRDFRDVILLDNTSDGEQTNFVLKLERFNQGDGLSWNASYTWSDAESVNDGTSSQARSQWRFNNVAGNPNDPGVGTPVYLVEQRFNAYLSYQFGFKQAPTTVTLFYNAQSGRPYGTTFSNSVNGDFESNDLLYVPSGPDEVMVVDRDGNDAWDQFVAYLDEDNGISLGDGIVERNASRAPWRRNLDFRLAQDVKISDYRFQLTLDIQNFMNLLDSDAGTIEFVSFNELSPVRYLGMDAETNRPVYRLDVQRPSDRFTTDDLRSRYRMKLGARFTF